LVTEAELLETVRAGSFRQKTRFEAHSCRRPWSLESSTTP
jgi:transposase-like protein